MSTAENLVKKRVNEAINLLKKDGHKIWHYMPVASRFGRAGVPDLVGLHDGRFWGLELKAKGGRVTALQQKTIDEIIAAGGKAMVMAPHDELTIKQQINNFFLGDASG